MADEFKQVAAIVCMDLKMLMRVSENESHDADFLRGMINMTYEKMLDAQNDPKKREMRYNAMCGIASIPKGQILSTEMPPKK